MCVCLCVCVCVRVQLLSFALGTLVPFLYPHPYVFIGVEQLVANMLADTAVAALGDITPS